MPSRRESDFERLERLLEEADQARQEADQARQQADQRAEDEQQARQEADQARQEADQARQEADQARQKADQRAEDEQKARQEADQARQRTTFQEFLRACHDNIHQALSIETDKSLTTKGVTSSKNKYYPKRLKPWDDYPRIQQEYFNEILDHLQPPDKPAPRLFSSIDNIEYTGRRLGGRKLASEKDLESYERFAVEEMVTDVISQSGNGTKVVFDNHTNSLSDMDRDVQAMQIQTPPETSPQSSRSPSPASAPESRPIRSTADQFCIYKDVYGKRQLSLVVEYKPAHKLSTGNLLGGFRPMDLEKEIHQRYTIPTNEEEKAQYNADNLVAAVATQIFHEMIRTGLSYSYITTGQVFVILHIKADEPRSLYYHVAVPEEDVHDKNLGFQSSQTAIAQVLSLCLLAFKSEPRSLKWREEIMGKLKMSKPDYEAILRNMPESERKLTPKSAKGAYKGRKSTQVRSPYRLRSRVNCNPSDIREPPASSEEDSDEPGSPSEAKQSGQKKNKRSHSEGQREAPKDESNNKQDTTERQYCTQGCLSGIARGSLLDENCPNVSEHRKSGQQHTVNPAEFASLVQEQLNQDLDNNFESLGIQGSRGALFKIILASHGYVFIGKGTVKTFKRFLLHEGAVYRHLESLQGIAVPVYLGNIDLLNGYYLDIGADIIHILLISWGGRGIATDERQSSSTINNELLRTVAQVRGMGIDQADLEPRNVLWNPEKRRIMLIDFERAQWIERNNKEITRRAMAELSPNKKRKQFGNQVESSKWRNRGAILA
jgi:hypothetical protein